LNGLNDLFGTDKTRRLLKVFGMAVTAFEDAVDKQASAEERRKAEDEVRTPARRSYRADRPAADEEEVMIPRSPLLGPSQQ
jgi:hypothetical protein